MPPFGEAHNHNVEQAGRVSEVLDAYRGAGVLYVQNLNSLPSTREELADTLRAAASLEVQFANGGLTGPGGHPSTIAAANIARGRWTAADGDGAFYHAISDTVTLDAAWRVLKTTKPDIVKVYLLYSDQYARRLSDSSTVGWRGINPALLPGIVRRAHATGLRLAVHVETAVDFRTASGAGVDMIAHLPGFRGDERTTLADPARFKLTDADARAAAQRQVAVVTTVSGLARYADEIGDRALRASADSLHVSNLRLLRGAGVRLAIGSDEYGDTSVGEAQYLHSLGLFTTAELLELWATTTPQVIFPERRIGRLAPGYEASFLVLDENPLDDFSAVSRIGRFVARGRTLPMQ